MARLAARPEPLPCPATRPHSNEKRPRRPRGVGFGAMTFPTSGTAGRAGGFPAVRLSLSGLNPADTVIRQVSVVSRLLRGVAVESDDPPQALAEY